MTENKKCSRCLKSLILNDFGIGKHGEYLKTCNNCREYFVQSRSNNREGINQQARAHYQEVREVKIEKALKYMAENIEKLTTKIECECGGRFQHRHKAEHKKTQKHQKYLSSLSIV